MFEVTGMELIPQAKNMSCWFASAQMLIRWHRTRFKATSALHPDPSQNSRALQWEVDWSTIPSLTLE